MIPVLGLAGAVTAQVLAFALLIGGIAIPGAFLAKAFVERMPVHIHTAILDVAVITGGLVMISAAARQLIRQTIAAQALSAWTAIESRSKRIHKHQLPIPNRKSPRLPSSTAYDPLRT